MEEELVSVIMPAYNAEKYIRMSIASVMLQTYKNVELVIVDDASTDHTLEIMLQCADTWQGRIKTASRTKNGGTAAALNDAIELADGKYICWLSADDLYCEDMIESEVNFLKQHQQYDAVFSRCSQIDENNRIFSTQSYEGNEEFFNAGMRGFIVLLLRWNFWHGCTVLAKSECFKQKERFNVNYRASQDYEFWLRMSADYNIGYLDQVTVLSRNHSEQGSKKMNCYLDEIRVFFHILRREDVMIKLYKKMEIPYTYQNIKPFIEFRVHMYEKKEEEMQVLSHELQKYMDMMLNGQLHFQNEN